MKVVTINLATANFQQEVSAFLASLKISETTSCSVVLTYAKDENDMEVDSHCAKDGPLQALDKLVSIPDITFQGLTRISLSVSNGLSSLLVAFACLESWDTVMG